MSATIPYVSGDFDIAEPITQLVFSEPFPGVNIAYVLTQEFMQNRSEWMPLPLNTPHPAYTEFLLVEESPLQDTGIAGVVKWTRTYAKVPASYDEPGGNYTYNFIGFVGSFGINVTTVSGRERFAKNVPVKVVRDFFLVDAAGNPGGPVYDMWQNIPVNEAQRYSFTSAPELDVDYIADSPPLAEATLPSRTEYEALIGTYIAAETSRLARWMGQIYVRETLYIKAE
jgi:hypothetical protein